MSPETTLPAVSFGLPQRPISEAMDAELAKLRTLVPSDKRAYATVGVSLTGVEAGIAYKPKPWWSLSGYAARQWGGGWEAGARTIFVW